MMSARVSFLISLVLLLAAGNAAPRVYELTRVNPRTIKMTSPSQIAIMGFKLGLEADAIDRIADEFDEISIQEDSFYPNIRWVLRHDREILILVLDHEQTQITEIHLLQDAKLVTTEQIAKTLEFARTKDIGLDAYAKFLTSYLGNPQPKPGTQLSLLLRRDPPDHERIFEHIEAQIEIHKAKQNHRHAARLQVVLDYKERELEIDNNSTLSDALREEFHANNRELRDTKLNSLKEPTSTRSIPPGFTGDATTIRQILGTPSRNSIEFKEERAKQIYDLIYPERTVNLFEPSSLIFEYGNGFIVQLIVDELNNKYSRLILIDPN